MKRRLITVLLAAAVALLASAGAAAQTQITFWHDWGGETTLIIEDLVRRFEAENPTSKWTCSSPRIWRKSFWSRSWAVWLPTSSCWTAG